MHKKFMANICKLLWRLSKTHSPRPLREGLYTPHKGTDKILHASTIQLERYVNYSRQMNTNFNGNYLHDKNHEF